MWVKRFFYLVVALFILTSIEGCGGSDGTNSKSNGVSQKIITGRESLVLTEVNNRQYPNNNNVVGATIEVYDDKGTLLARKENATDEKGKFEIRLQKKMIQIIT